jgi:hypothetical protein
MIFSLLIIYNHDRKSPITSVIRTKTWNYFTSYLSDHFGRCPKAVKQAIMTDINDLLQDFWRTSSDGVVGTSLFAMRRLHEILQQCFNVCFNIYPFARLPFK